MKPLATWRTIPRSKSFPFQNSPRGTCRSLEGFPQLNFGLNFRVTNQTLRKKTRVYNQVPSFVARATKLGTHSYQFFTASQCRRRASGGARPLGCRTVVCDGCTGQIPPVFAFGRFCSLKAALRPPPLA